MKVLVTGAAGFIGSHLTEKLVARGHLVVPLTRTGRLSPAGSNGYAGDGVCVDLEDAAATRAAIMAVRPDAVVHLAWYATPGEYWTSFRNLDSVRMSVTLAQALADAGCRRFVGAGSCAEYDWEYGFCSEERTPVRPASLYGVCKNATREVLEGFCALAGMSFAWVRFFYLYGPREHASRLVPSLVAPLLARTVAKCTAGEQRRDFLHVADAAEAVCHILEGPASGVVNIGSGVPVTVRTIAELLGEATGAKDYLAIGSLPMRANDPPLIVADVRRLRQETTWSPTMSLEEGLADTVAWWIREGVER